MKKMILTVFFLSLALNAYANDAVTLEGSSKTNKPVVARQRETLKEKLIGKFVKTFAKTYIATTNLKKFKEKNIKKLKKMDEAKFQRIYKKIYKEMMVDLPQSLKDAYGVAEEMTREKAIERINSFTTKRQIYKLINAIPNKMIAQHFKKHKKEFKRAMKSKTGGDEIVDQILTDPAGSS